MQTMDTVINQDQIIVDRQALLDLVASIDVGLRGDRLPRAMDALREPFFPDEISSGNARKDFAVNKYR